MKTRICKYGLALLLAVLSLTAFAQKPKVEARIGSLEILIGEHVPITVTVEAKQGAQVEFPTETLLPVDVECLGQITNEDEKLPGGLLRQSRSYVMTSFVDTLYEIPPFKVMVDGEEYQTNSLPLKVLTIDVDTTFVEQFNGPKYYGPKDVQDVEFNWTEDVWGRGLYITILLPIILLLMLYLAYRLITNKPVIAKIRIVKHELPHLKAMKSIEKIKADKMSASENQKEYYTKLTDTLRQYINERYGFNAMEMTSSEIIDRLTKTDDPKSLDELRQLFETADLVKFAKYSTLINENDANLVNAIDFINQTKREDMTTEEIIKPELTNEQQRSRKSRMLLQVSVFLLVAGIVALTLFVIDYLYDLL